MSSAPSGPSQTTTVIHVLEGVIPMSAQIADATGSSGDLMFIELRGRDSRVVYLVRKATPIIELMLAYVKALGEHVEDIRFLHDYVRLPHEGTVDEVGLVNGSIIEIVRAQPYWGVHAVAEWQQLGLGADPLQALIAERERIQFERENRQAFQDT